MECPKREYYFVSNLTDSHEYEYIKPIGEFIVEFLNADLEGYDESLKRLYDVVFETEIPDPMYPAIPFMEFMMFVQCSSGDEMVSTITFTLCVLSFITHIVYVVFIYIRAWILEFNAEVPYIYPYFFLNLDTQGVAGVLKWVGVLLAAFIVVGFIFFGLDRLVKSPKED